MPSTGLLLPRHSPVGSGSGVCPKQSQETRRGHAQVLASPSTLSLTGQTSQPPSPPGSRPPTGVRRRPLLSAGMPSRFRAGLQKDRSNAQLSTACALAAHRVPAPGHRPPKTASPPSPHRSPKQQISRMFSPQTCTGLVLPHFTCEKAESSKH